MKNGLVAKAVGYNQVVPSVSRLYDEKASVIAGRVGWCGLRGLMAPRLHKKRSIENPPPDSGEGSL
jgi:hypothetical protein